MRKINLSIVIPTLNEELFIGTLLDSIIKQTVQPKEIIVVDAKSKDRTAAEVLKRKKKLPMLQVIKTDQYTVARQRNIGAVKATHPHLLFLDADMFLKDKHTLENYFEKVREKNPILATCYVMPISPHKKDKLFYLLADILTTLVSHIVPASTTMNLYARRDIFIKSGGFNERIHVAEDFEFVKRVGKKYGKFMVFRSPRMYTSIRRPESEGRIRYGIKLIRIFVQILRYGYEDNPIEYEFGKFQWTK